MGDDTEDQTEATPDPDQSAYERELELVEKGKLFEKLEELSSGSEIEFGESNGQKNVRIKVKGTGLHATYLHGKTLAKALNPPETT